VVRNKVLKAIAVLAVLGALVGCNQYWTFCNADQTLYGYQTNLSGTPNLTKVNLVPEGYTFDVSSAAIQPLDKVSLWVFEESTGGIWRYILNGTGPATFTLGGFPYDLISGEPLRFPGLSFANNGGLCGASLASINGENDTLWFYVISMGGEEGWWANAQGTFYGSPYAVSLEYDSIGLACYPAAATSSVFYAFVYQYVTFGESTRQMSTIAALDFNDPDGFADKTWTCDTTDLDLQKIGLEFGRTLTPGVGTYPLFVVSANEDGTGVAYVVVFIGDGTTPESTFTLASPINMTHVGPNLAANS
jgi:hypothetical protein